MCGPYYNVLGNRPWEATSTNVTSCPYILTVFVYRVACFPSGDPGYPAPDAPCFFEQLSASVAIFQSSLTYTTVKEM